MHHFDIQDIYKGKWKEKQFVNYIKENYKRKSDKLWRTIIEPGIEPKTFSEADYQKTKQLVMNAQTAKDLSKIFPDNKFLRDAVDAFEFINTNKRSTTKMKDSAIVRRINFLKNRRYRDAMYINKLKRRLDLGTGAKIALGVPAAGILGFLFGKYVINPLGKKLDISMIYDGSYPEGEFVRHFQNQFASGAGMLKRSVDPEIWDQVSESEFEKYRNKVMSARRVSDLVRIFPNSRWLAEANAAYKQAKASGIY